MSLHAVEEGAPSAVAVPRGDLAPWSGKPRKPGRGENAFLAHRGSGRRRQGAMLAPFLYVHPSAPDRTSTPRRAWNGKLYCKLAATHVNITSATEQRFGGPTL